MPKVFPFVTVAVSQSLKSHLMLFMNLTFIKYCKCTQCFSWAMGWEYSDGPLHSAGLSPLRGRFKPPQTEKVSKSRSPTSKECSNHSDMGSHHFLLAVGLDRLKSNPLN